MTDNFRLIGDWTDNYQSRSSLAVKIKMDIKFYIAYLSRLPGLESFGAKKEGWKDSIAALGARDSRGILPRPC